jgi:hypothetical protein
VADAARSAELDDKQQREPGRPIVARSQASTRRSPLSPPRGRDAIQPRNRRAVETLAALARERRSLSVVAGADRRIRSGPRSRVTLGRLPWR